MSDDAERAGSVQPARGLARSATVLFAGNAVSRVLGLVREMVIAYYFGATGQVSAFRVAAQVPTLLYDFLVGGMLSAALVPVLSDYLRTRPREEFLRLVGVLLGIFAVLLAGLVIVLEISAPLVAQLLAGGFDRFDPTLLPLTVRLIRLVTPAVWFFSMAGVVTAILYARERFTYPALATAVYNLGIVLSAPLLAARLGVTSLAVGILAGSLAQLTVMTWDLRRSGPTIHLSLDLRHPALRRILLLYAPIAAGLLVSLFQVGLDRRLASSTGAQSIAWMANATTLQQMPLGLISVAIALASLPRLSQYFAIGDEDAYRRTVSRGLRMVLVLILPAAVGLWSLGLPVTRLLFERGDFTGADTQQVARALDIYLIGMLFAAIDFPLNYAFYARNNTILPAVVGVISVGVYMIVAYQLLTPLGYLGLVWADTAKQAAHACIMFCLLLFRVGRLDGDMGRALIVLLLGAMAMFGTQAFLAQLPGLARLAQGPLVSLLLYVAVLGAAGLAAYGGVLYVAGLREARELMQRVRG